jgi:multidrug efflux pump subunit AcrB
VLPLLTAFGAGANARFAIGLMIAAGMLVGTLFTLFVLPTFYLVMGGSSRTVRDLDVARARAPIEAR